MNVLLITLAILAGILLWALVGSVVAGLMARSDPFYRPDGDGDWGLMAYIGFTWPLFVVLLLVLSIARRGALVPFKSIVRKVGGFQ